MQRPATLFPAVGLPLPAAILAQHQTGSNLWATGAALVAPLGLIAWRGSQARNDAENAFMQTWGAGHGLVFAEDIDALPDIPLLRRGDERHAENGLMDVRNPTRDLTLAHYVYVVKSRDSNGKQRREEHQFTICHLTLNGRDWSALPHFQLHQREPFTLRLPARLRALVSDERLVEMESIEFNDQFTLSVAEGQDELGVRQVFTPAFIAWLLDQAPSDLICELERDTLLVALPGRIRDAARLDGLLDSVLRIEHDLSNAHPNPEMAPR